MQSDSEAPAPQDAVGPFDRRRASRALRFSSEIDAEQWEQDGRVDESPYTGLGDFEASRSDVRNEARAT
jgi:hypothetical protein